MGEGGSVIGVMGEGLLHKRPCFPKTWRREPSVQMLGKGHLGRRGGAHAGSWAEHSGPAQRQWESQHVWSRVGTKRKVTKVGRLGGASHRNLDLCSAATVGFETQ